MMPYIFWFALIAAVVTALVSQHQRTKYEEWPSDNTF